MQSQDRVLNSLRKLQINERLWVYTVYDKLSETEDANSNGHSHTSKWPQVKIYLYIKFQTRRSEEKYNFHIQYYLFNQISLQRQYSYKYFSVFKKKKSIKNYVIYSRAVNI